MTTRRDSTSSATGASPTSSPTAAGAGATPGWSSATAPRCSSTPCSTCRSPREMLDAMAPPHRRGADRHGGQHPRQRRPLLRQPAGGAAEIIASAAAAEEMTEVPPAMLAALNAAPGEVGDAVPPLLRRVRLRRHRAHAAHPHVRRPARPRGRRPGGRADRGRPGPHPGDTLAYVPDARTVYTGDILFIGGTPIVWAGPLSNWIAACDLILGMDVDTVVPGHGPVTDKAASPRCATTSSSSRRRRRRATPPASTPGRPHATSRSDGFGELERVRPHRRQRRHRVPHARSLAPQPGRRRAVPAHGRARTTGGDVRAAVLERGR